MVEVVCAGHVTLDAITLVDRLPTEDERVMALGGRLAGGGPAATAAVALARMGVETAFLGAVGDDEAGREAVDALAREGVDVSAVRRLPGATAFSTIAVSARSGSRSIVAANGVSGVPPLGRRETQLIAGAHWLHVDHVGAALLHEPFIGAVSTLVSVDAGNPIEGLDLSRIALYAPTAARLRALAGVPDTRAAATAALDAGARQVVATAGGDGAIVAERRGDGTIEFHDVRSFDVSVVSTLGAGDVFHGAVLAGLVRGLDLVSAATLAAAAAALSCRALDGRSAAPTWTEAVEFAAASGRPIAAIAAGDAA